MLHPNFRSRVTIGRRCNDDGTWGPVDDSNCTALNTSSMLIVSFEVNVSRATAEHVVDNVSLYIRMYCIRNYWVYFMFGKLILY